MAVENLIIWQKLKELHIYIVKVLRHYPKSERFTLGQRTQNKLLDMVETTIEANAARDKTEILPILDAQLSQLRFLIDSAHEMEIISTKQYFHISEKTTEIGKMIGGWRKRFNA